MEGREGLLFPYKERRILFFSVAGGVGGMGESAACGRLGMEGRGYVLKSTKEGDSPPLAHGKKEAFPPPPPPPRKKERRM